MLVIERDCWSLFPRLIGMGTIPSHGARCSTAYLRVGGLGCHSKPRRKTKTTTKKKGRKELSKNVNGRKER